MLCLEILVQPYNVILVQVGVNFWKVGVWVKANGVVVSWLRQQTASDCISHPDLMYTKCFSTLICCGWTYVCTLTLSYRCKWGWFFGKLGCGWDQMLLWCHGWGYKQHQKASKINIICIQSVLAPWYAVDGDMGAPLHCYTCVSGGEFLNNWGLKRSVPTNGLMSALTA